MADVRSSRGDLLLYDIIAFSLVCTWLGVAPEADIPASADVRSRYCYQDSLYTSTHLEHSLTSILLTA